MTHLFHADFNFLHASRRQPSLFDNPVEHCLDNGTQVEIRAPGVICFEPRNPGNKDIIYSCGIHGNETAPIEICDQIVQDILAKKVILKHRLMVIFGNLPAMDISQRFVEENLNRLFDGEHANPDVPANSERERAALLESEVHRFFNDVPNYDHRSRFHYDLHTAIRESKNEKFAVYPYAPERQRKPAQLMFLKKCGVSTILLSESPTTTFSYHSSKHYAADAFTVELGKVRPFGENDMSRFEATDQTLRALITESDIDLSGFDEADFDIYTVNQIINRETKQFSFTFADDEPNFSDYPKGTLLAKDGEQEYRATEDGEAIVFPNAKVALGQRALLTVIPTKLN